MGAHFTGPGPGEIVVKLASNPQTTKTADFSSTASGHSQISQGVFSISSGGTPGQLLGSLGVPRKPPNSGCQALGSCMIPPCPSSVCPSAKGFVRGTLKKKFWRSPENSWSEGR